MKRQGKVLSLFGSLPVIAVSALCLFPSQSFASDANVTPPTSGSMETNPAGASGTGTTESSTATGQTQTQNQNQGFVIPAPVAHEILEQVEGVRGSVQDLVQKISAKSGDIGAADWNANSAAFGELSRSVERMEGTLDRKAEVTESVWSTAYNGQINSLSSAMTRVGEVLQQPRALEVLGNGFAGELDDVRESAEDLVSLISKRGERFNFPDWNARKQRLDGLQSRLDTLEGSLGGNAEAARAQVPTAATELSTILSQVGDTLKGNL